MFPIFENPFHYSYSCARDLGVISDYDIIETCLLDMDKNQSFINYFKPNVYDAGFIFTQRSH